MSNKDSSDFMLAEYDRISTAYFDLRRQTDEWFKAYLALVGLPLTILAAVLNLSGGNAAVSLTTLPDVVAGLLVLVSLLGLFVTLTIVSMRMEMILYARTINGVRRYFGEADKHLCSFLILPTSDTLPSFYEPFRAMFWQVLMLGFLNGVIAAIGILSLLGTGWLSGVAIGGCVVVLNWAAYYGLAHHREHLWKVRFPTGLSEHQI